MNIISKFFEKVPEWVSKYPKTALGGTAVVSVMFVGNYVSSGQDGPDAPFVLRERSSESTCSYTLPETMWLGELALKATPNPDDFGDKAATKTILRSSIEQMYGRKAYTLDKRPLPKGLEVPLPPESCILFDANGEKVSWSTPKEQILAREDDQRRQEQKEFLEDNHDGCELVLPKRQTLRSLAEKTAPDPKNGFDKIAAPRIIAEDNVLPYESPDMYLAKGQTIVLDKNRCSVAKENPSYRGSLRTSGEVLSSDV